MSPGPSKKRMLDLERNYFGTFMTALLVLPFFLYEMYVPWAEHLLEHNGIDAIKVLFALRGVGVVTLLLFLFYRPALNEPTMTKSLLNALVWLAHITVFPFANPTRKEEFWYTAFWIMRHIIFGYLPPALYINPVAKAVSRLVLPFHLPLPQGLVQNWLGSLMLVLTVLGPALVATYQLVDPDSLPSTGLHWNDLRIWTLLACLVGGFCFLRLGINYFAASQRQPFSSFMCLLIPVMCYLRFRQSGAEDSALVPGVEILSQVTMRMGCLVYAVFGVLATGSLLSPAESAWGRLYRPYLAVPVLEQDLEYGGGERLSPNMSEK